MTRQAHELDHRIVGDDMQCVEITRDPGETVVAEAGTMMMMDEGIAMQTIFGDGRGQSQGFLDKMLGAVWQAPAHWRVVVHDGFSEPGSGQEEGRVRRRASGLVSPRHPHLSAPRA